MEKADLKNFDLKKSPAPIIPVPITGPEVHKRTENLPLTPVEAHSRAPQKLC